MPAYARQEINASIGMIADLVMPAIAICSNLSWRANHWVIIPNAVIYLMVTGYISLSGIVMGKPPKKLKPEQIETKPDAWEWFEHAVDAAVKSGPKHRTATGKSVTPKRPKPGKEKPTK
ncbi:MAG: hypothetical protein IH905_17945 [Proteobacteria bacterium]|nr:hypothetical protein [Pseudomonadota bacterium]